MNPSHTPSWRVVRDGISYAMLESPDGRVFSLRELNGGGPRTNGGPWATPTDNDKLVEQFVSVLSETKASPVAWWPEQQNYPGGPIYRVGSSTGVGAPQPSQEAIDFEEAARDRRDAERYRWLLEKWSTSHGAHHVEWRFDIGCAEVYGLEALIDKAMEDK